MIFKPKAVSTLIFSLLLFVIQVQFKFSLYTLCGRRSDFSPYEHAIQITQSLLSCLYAWNHNDCIWHSP